MTTSKKEHTSIIPPVLFQVAAVVVTFWLQLFEFYVSY